MQSFPTFNHRLPLIDLPLPQGSSVATKLSEDSRAMLTKTHRIYEANWCMFTLWELSFDSLVSYISAWLILPCLFYWIGHEWNCVCYEISGFSRQLVDLARCMLFIFAFLRSTVLSWLTIRWLLMVNKLVSLSGCTVGRISCFARSGRIRIWLLVCILAILATHRPTR